MVCNTRLVDYRTSQTPVLNVKEEAYANGMLEYTLRESWRMCIALMGLQQQDTGIWERKRALPGMEEEQRLTL